ncbi:putative oxidoreductase YrbE [Diplonema papillatum]|nr:putative oxidoreductase YrbE [Diplonema papillatum]
MASASNGSTKPLGIALIGAGMVAKTHMAAIAAAQPAVKLCGVLARTAASSTALVDSFAGRFEARPAVYETLADLLGDDRVDAVVVATPPNVRMELVQPLAKAGKHILLEKPVARTLAEAEALVAVCEEAGATLAVVFQHRFRAASLAARKLLDTDDLGNLGLAEIAVPWWRDQGYYNSPGRGTYERDGGGVLISQAIHTIDLALSLTGPVRSVQAMTATTCFHKMEGEDFAVAGLQFAGGAVGSFTASTASFPGSPETVVLHFENASVRLDSGVLTVARRGGGVETFGAAAGTGGGADPMAFTHEWHQAVLEDFAAAVRSARSPLVTGREALKAHAFIHAIEASAKDGQRVQV